MTRISGKFSRVWGINVHSRPIRRQKRLFIRRLLIAKMGSFKSAYLSYDGWGRHEHKAFHEFSEETNLTFTY